MLVAILFRVLWAVGLARDAVAEGAELAHKVSIEGAE
jgi:hypothetical protein